MQILQDEHVCDDMDILLDMVLDDDTDEKWSKAILFATSHQKNLKNLKRKEENLNIEISRKYRAMKFIMERHFRINLNIVQK